MPYYNPDEVMAFQRQAGITVDGIVGPETLGAGWQGGYTAAQPPTSEIVGWENQRRQLRDNQGGQLAQIGFQRGNAKQQQAVDAQRLAAQYAQMRESLPNQYIRRGLLNSGIQKTGEEKRLEQENNARYDMATRYQQMLGQLDLNQWQANTQYAGGMAGIDAAEAARRADLAAQLRGIY